MTQTATDFKLGDKVYISDSLLYTGFVGYISDIAPEGWDYLVDVRITNRRGHILDRQRGFYRDQLSHFE
jgi:hypothetical protein